MVAPDLAIRFWALEAAFRRTERMTGKPEAIEFLPPQLQMFSLVKFLNKVSTSSREAYMASAFSGDQTSRLVSHKTRLQRTRDTTRVPFSP
jgi:hypothetical protein